MPGSFGSEGIKMEEIIQQNVTNASNNSTSNDDDTRYQQGNY
jgi:hypothetical protein